VRPIYGTLSITGYVGVALILFTAFVTVVYVPDTSGAENTRGVPLY